MPRLNWAGIRVGADSRYARTFVDVHAMHSTALPEPSADALAHSGRLRGLIAAEIRKAGGALPFWRYMELCLYAPGLGYYSAGSRKFGADGDFVTASELGDLFAQCMAQALTPALRELGEGAEFFEIGGGSGVFAEQMLRQFDAHGLTLGRYALLEPSADLRERQREHLAATLRPELFARVAWLDGPPEREWRGVLFANEVLDALPTPRFVLRDGEVYEECVALDVDGGFRRVDRPADALLSAAVRHAERDLLGDDVIESEGSGGFTDGYRSELLPQLPYWIQAVGGLLRDGAMLFVDYGYPRREFYLPERRTGTLMCHYRHRAHSDPYALVGLQDITASVDFTALAEAGVNAGFDLAGYCTQGQFLLANGLGSALEAAQEQPEIERYALAQQAKRLTLPGEMGERFQIMGFHRGVDISAAFALGDLTRRL
jgi:SAM-dependent MidA family methyltransferase